MADILQLKTAFAQASETVFSFPLARTAVRSEGLLPFVFAFAHLFEHGEAGFLRVGDGERLELFRRTERGENLAHRLLARRAIRQRLGGQWAVQGEFSTAHLAVTFAQFVFVNRHSTNPVRNLSQSPG